MHLRFRQIRYFVEIVDAGSLTAAALRLNLVPTALSLQIKKLEDQFGVTLLERHARGMTPTPLGREFYANSRRLLDLIVETERTLVGRRDTPDRLRIGLPPSVMHALGVRVLLPEAGTGIDVDLVEGLTSELMVRLEAKELDLVLAWIALDHPTVNLVEVAEEALVYVTAPDSSTPEGPIHLAEALQTDLITIGNRSMSWNAVRRNAAAIGLHIKAARVVESTDLVRRMLRNGFGSAILPVSFVAEEMRAGTLKIHPLKGAPLTRRLSLPWPKSASWLMKDRQILRYCDNLIAEFYKNTAPHSRLLETPVLLEATVESLGEPEQA